MIDQTRVRRLGRLRTRLRASAASELARHAGRVAALDAEIERLGAAADEARTSGAGGGTGAAIVPAWAWADALGRRAATLAGARACAAGSVATAHDVVRVRRREEEQLARLAARATVRLDERAARRRAAALDELALWLHGRKR